MDIRAIYHRSMLTQFDPEHPFSIGALVRRRRPKRAHAALGGALQDTPSMADEGEDEDEEIEGEEEEGEIEELGTDAGLDISGPTQLDPGYTPDGEVCAACQSGGGVMIPCDGGCDRTFHLRCVGLRALPAQNWMCGDCSCAPSPGDEDDGMPSTVKRQRPSQRRRAALQALYRRHWN